MPAETDEAKILVKSRVMHAVWRQGKNGEWLLFGPLAVLMDRRGPVDVLKRDGTLERRRVVWRSAPFLVDGIEYCFARPAEKRRCIACDGWHHMDQVRSIYAGGTMKTGAYWRHGEKTCSCGGALA